MSTAQALATAQSALHPPRFAQLAPREVHRLSPAEIREVISGMVSEGRMELATSIAEAALALHPLSEDVLVISSLLAEVHEDWARAETLLVQLATLQGADSTAFTWLHLVKVLNCQKKWGDAWLAASHACERFPDNQELAQELQELSRVIRPESQTQAA